MVSLRDLYAVLVSTRWTHYHAPSVFFRCASRRLRFPLVTVSRQSSRAARVRKYPRMFLIGERYTLRIQKLMYTHYPVYSFARKCRAILDIAQARIFKPIFKEQGGNQSPMEFDAIANIRVNAKKYEQNTNAKGHKKMRDCVIKNYIRASS